MTSKWKCFWICVWALKTNQQKQFRTKIGTKTQQKKKSDYLRCHTPSLHHCFTVKQDIISSSAQPSLTLRRNLIYFWVRILPSHTLIFPKSHTHLLLRKYEIYSVNPPDFNDSLTFVKCHHQERNLIAGIINWTQTCGIYLKAAAFFRCPSFKFRRRSKIIRRQKTQRVCACVCTC